MSVLFRPNRAHRREIAGRPCAACGLGLHWTEIFAVRTDDSLVYLHGQCAQELAARTQDDEPDV